MSTSKTAKLGLSATKTKHLMYTVTSIPPHLNAKSLMSEKEYHALKETYKFLCALVDPKVTPRIAKPYREMARKCLENYPNSKDYCKAVDTFYFFNPR
jgi:hypothetical protein